MDQLRILMKMQQSDALSLKQQNNHWLVLLQFTSSFEMVICPLSRHASAWNYQSTEDIPKKECKKQQDTHRQL